MISKTKLFALVLFALSIPSSHAFNDTSDFWRCENRVGGAWVFGRVPYACDVQPFGEPAYVQRQFAPVIFDDLAGQPVETSRYMESLNSVIRDTSDYYLSIRKPNASTAEKQAWRYAIFAVAHQETFWSHYRNATDSRIKMVRGDSGHGHGMMQVDDRWHFTAINEGKGWQLIENMIYALEIFYTEWQRAVTASCVSSTTQWRSRTRSAYSAYNGGPNQICRWTDPNHVWAQNDQNFVQKYDAQGWNQHITDPNAASPIDVVCLVEGNENCPPGSDDTQRLSGKLLEIASGEVCVFNDNTLRCTDDKRDAVCLAKSQNVSIAGGQLTLAPENYEGLPQQRFDRHDCNSHVGGLLAVGQVLQTQLAINLRATPGGAWLATTIQGQHYQIIDFEVRDENQLYRYYRVRHQNTEGYIYAGSVSDHSSWALPSTNLPFETIIARPNDWIEIVIGGGINLRNTPAGSLITVVPQDTVSQVLTTQFKGPSNQVYYGIEYAGATGYIYGGRLLPDATLAQWANLTSAPIVFVRTGRASDTIWWTSLRECAETSCKSSGYVIGGYYDSWCQRFGCGWRQSHVTELDNNLNGWVRLRVDDSGQKGWIEERFIIWD